MESNRLANPPPASQKGRDGRTGGGVPRSTSGLPPAPRRHISPASRLLLLLLLLSPTYICRGEGEKREGGERPTFLPTRRVMESTLFNSEILPSSFPPFPILAICHSDARIKKGKGKGGGETKFYHSAHFRERIHAFRSSLQTRIRLCAKFVHFSRFSQAASSPFTRSQRTRASPAATRYAEHVRYT